jgi:hypothetical protein
VPYATASVIQYPPSSLPIKSSLGGSQSSIVDMAIVREQDGLGSTEALVVSEAGGAFELRNVELKEMRSDEIVVEMRATGICHTDLASAHVRPLLFNRTFSKYIEQRPPPPSNEYNCLPPLLGTQRPRLSGYSWPRGFGHCRESRS